jgi:hypothetical protein
VKTTVQLPADVKPGATIEIDVPGVVAETEVSTKYTPNDAVSRIVQDRLAQFGRSHVKLEDITAKPEVKQQVLDLLGIKPQTGTDGDIGKQLERHTAELREREIKPLTEKLTAGQAEIETLRRDRLTDNIVAAAARVGVKATLLTPPVAGAKPAIVAMLEQTFGFDDKTRQWYVRGASADQPFAFAAQPSAAQPYKGVDEALKDWAKQPANREFIGIVTQGGPGLGGGGGPSGGVGFISTADARDPRKYRIAKDAAQKAGVELQLTD